jgi:23S rRNA (adenine2503-C2)-methyltransferase
MGLLRNLTVDEFSAQLQLSSEWMQQNHEWRQKWNVTGRVTNLVFMGMGEPLDNFEALLDFLPIAMDQRGFCIAQKNICVSTVGRMDKLRELHRLYPRLPVAISLHSGSSKLRSRLMPIEKEYGLKEIGDFFCERLLSHNKDPRILLQMLMIEGVNNLPEHAQAVVDFLVSTGLPRDRYKKVKVNLIPFNSFDESAFQEPTASSVESFRDILAKAGLRVLVRFSKLAAS